jgi:hypothetical protein
VPLLAVAIAHRKFAIDLCAPLQDYIAFQNKAAVVLPHTAGRYQMKRFRKATVCFSAV